MRNFLTLTMIVLFATPAFAAKPPTDVNIVNQPVNVTGAVNATVSNPVTVNGSVNATVNNPVEVTNPSGQSLNVTIDPASQETLSHLGRSINDNIQLQATSLPITAPAILETERITPEGGGGIFTLDTGKCLVITEVEVEYINANTGGLPAINFRFGLTDEGHTQVSGRRMLTSIVDNTNNGTISETFPSGLVFKVSADFPALDRVGLQTFNARVVNFAASGYTMDCN